MIDFTKVVNGLEYRESDKNKNENISSFTLNVTDRNGNAPEAGPVSFSVKVLPVELSLQNPSYLKIGDTEMDIELAFNGGDPADKVTFKVRDFNGWAQVKAEYTKKSDNVYTAHLSGMPTYYSPSNGNKTTVMAEFTKNDGTIKDFSIDVERHGVIADVSENDVFAKYAYVRIQPININYEDLKISIPSEGSKVVTPELIADDLYKLNGLTPATDYRVLIAKEDGKIDPVTLVFNTEEIIELANSDFDATFTINGSASHWENVEVPGNQWGTNNPMTTSQGGNYGYVRISGTIQTDDSHSGKAALIRTVGWGSGNTATGSEGSSGKTKYTDVGLLHLGSSRTERPEGYKDREGALTTDDLVCGIDFTSRPSSISFWYKYQPKNPSDQGEAEVWVKDKSGNIIAQSIIRLPAESQYKKIDLPLTYKLGDNKAATLYIKFISTYSRDFLEKTDANFSGPGFANVTRGTYMGSQLYVDDIELVY